MFGCRTPGEMEFLNRRQIAGFRIVRIGIAVFEARQDSLQQVRVAIVLRDGCFDLTYALAPKDRTTSI